MAIIDISNGNSKFKAINGVLFDKEKTVLISCHRQLVGFRVLDGIEKIGDGTFSGCAELTSIAEWKSNGEIVTGFCDGNGKLVIKGKGLLEVYAYGNMACPLRDYDYIQYNNFAPRIKKYGMQIQ